METKIKPYYPIDSFKREQRLQEVRLLIEVNTLKGLKAICTLKELTNNTVILKPKKYGKHS